MQGIEFSDKAALGSVQLCYRVHSGPLETAPQPDEPFFIMGLMAMERLHDPVGGLQKLREWAKPGACLALSVPNAGSQEFLFFKDRWYALQLPTHFYHFTPASLEEVQSAGGWQLEKVHHHRILNKLVACMGFVLYDKGYAKFGRKFIDFPDRIGRWSYFLHPLACLLSVFGQTGRMTELARVK